MKGRGLVWIAASLVAQASLVIPATLAVSASAQSTEPTARLLPLPPSENAAAAHAAQLSRLPPHASHVAIERGQIAHLVAPGQPELWLVPVRFWHGEPWALGSGQTLADRDRCGLFIMSPCGGSQYFLFTIRPDQDLAVDQCGGLRAIARDGGGPHPSLKLTYRTFAPPRQEDTVQLQLLWDSNSGRYTVGPAND